MNGDGCGSMQLERKRAAGNMPNGRGLIILLLARRKSERKRTYVVLFLQRRGSLRNRRPAGRLCVTGASFSWLPLPEAAGADERLARKGRKWRGSGGTWRGRRLVRSDEVKPKRSRGRKMGSISCYPRVRCLSPRFLEEE